MRAIFASALFAYAYASNAEYVESEQGANWTDLCSTGTAQSPIDLPGTGGTAENDTDMAIVWGDNAEFSDLQADFNDTDDFAWTETWDSYYTS